MSYGYDLDRTETIGPVGVTRAQVLAARRTVARHARRKEDWLTLCEALGIDTVPEETP